ncbi:MAG: YceI family protein [Ostreibacterium sp.]
MKFTKILLATTLFAGLSLSVANAADYTIDNKGAHAAINFKIQHLGYSWLTGRFNTFSGNFSYDADQPDSLSVKVDIAPASVDSNHAERDKHIRGGDFFDVEKYATASFTSTGFTPSSDGNGDLAGNLNFHGVTKPITIAVTKVGEGDDPWGGYRVGFAGKTEINLSDFGIKNTLGPKSETVTLDLFIEGIRQ